MKPYEYSTLKVAPLTTAGKPRYRGRCSCGRQTHQAYSTPVAARNAIKSVHNPTIKGEEHDE